MSESDEEIKLHTASKSCSIKKQIRNKIKTKVLKSITSNLNFKLQQNQSNDSYQKLNNRKIFDLNINKSNDSTKKSMNDKLSLESVVSLKRFTFDTDRLSSRRFDQNQLNSKSKNKQATEMIENYEKFKTENYKLLKEIKTLNETNNNYEQSLKNLKNEMDTMYVNMINMNKIQRNYKYVSQFIVQNDKPKTYEYLQYGKYQYCLSNQDRCSISTESISRNQLLSLKQLEDINDKNIQNILLTKLKVIMQKYNQKSVMCDDYHNTSNKLQRKIDSLNYEISELKKQQSSLLKDKNQFKYKSILNNSVAKTKFCQDYENSKTDYQESNKLSNFASPMGLKMEKTFTSPMSTYKYLNNKISSYFIEKFEKQILSVSGQTQAKQNDNEFQIFGIKNKQNLQDNRVRRLIKTKNEKFLHVEITQTSNDFGLPEPRFDCVSQSDVENSRLLIFGGLVLGRDIKSLLKKRLMERQIQQNISIVQASDSDIDEDIVESCEFVLNNSLWVYWYDVRCWTLVWVEQPEGQESWRQQPRITIWNSTLIIWGGRLKDNNNNQQSEEQADGMQLDLNQLGNMMVPILNVSSHLVGVCQWIDVNYKQDEVQQLVKIYYDDNNYVTRNHVVSVNMLNLMSKQQLNLHKMTIHQIKTLDLLIFMQGDFHLPLERGLIDE